MKKPGLIALALAISTTSFGQAIAVYVNGEPVAFSGVSPQKIGGRVLVPLRGVMEKLGAYVSYQAATKTVTANRGDVDLQLTLGRRNAILNGREVTLDVPAMEYRGSTLVPLRFMGEALGADVRWDAAANAVRIFTDGGSEPTDPVNPPNTGGGTIEIEGFDVTGSEILKAGSVVEFTLRGTPGGTASVQIPGIVRDLVLRETSRGVYTGSYTVPVRNNSEVTVSKATVIAKLRVGREERLIQASDTFQFDNLPPSISSITPEPNGRVNALRPNITAVFSDQSGTGVDVNKVRLVIDGRDVTSDATITSNLLAFRPTYALTVGKHEAAIEVFDLAGNRTTRNWEFTVVDKANVITSFQSNAAREIQPGDEIVFTLTGEPKATVNLQIGDIRTLAMEETTPGKYTAAYVVRRTDRLDGIVVTAKVKTRSGETFTTDLTLGSRVAGSDRLSVPTISSHENGGKVGRTATFRGKADPNARVLLRIEFSQRVLGAIPMNGVIGEVEVQADSRGNWETKEVDLDTGLGRDNITYTLTAVTLGEEDARSEPVKITLKR